MEFTHIKRTGYVLGALLVTSMMAGCGAASTNAAPQHSDTTNLSMSIDYTYQPSVAPIQALIRAYEQAHPHVHITLELGVDKEKTASQLAAGDAPDIVILGTARDLGSFAYDHGVIPLNTLIHQSHFPLNELVPATVKQGESPYNGKIYGLTFLEDTYEVYYNPALFKAAGITALPKNLTQMVADARLLTKTNSAGQITQLGWDPSIWDEDKPNLSAIFGGTVANPQGTQSTIDNPAFVRGLAWNQSAYQAQGGYQAVSRFVDSFAEGGTNAGQNGSVGPFASGREGMIVRGDYYTNKLQLLVPHLHYGTFLLPAPASGPNIVGGTPLGGNPVCITADDKDPGPAWQFMSWMLTDGQVYLAKHQLLTGNWSATPNYIPLLRQPDLEPNPHFRWFWHVMLTDPNKFTLPMMANIAQYTALIDQYSQEAMQGSISASAAAHDIQVQENRDLSGLGVQ